MSGLKILIASRNRGKIKEIEAALALPGVDFDIRPDLPDVEEDGSDFFENAMKKARSYALWSGQPALADDSGLEVDVLKGAPGIFSARFSGPAKDDRANNEKLLRMMEGVPFPERGAAFRAVIVLYTLSGEWVRAEGTCRGIILESPRGENGFGYDPLFFLPELGKTMAELTTDMKNKLSHRARALEELKKKLLSQDFRHLLNFNS
ncbi:RdgB/HAM1 family non-canonical purine NTP pyrophosphatase [Candidatus Mcinerneyibacteriota bacterium]|nr:RdgB/HAM1 family non-canonical purine NTP pyrophosphatase [Candidatus Mcinerneyibacteriota bacterium]